MIRFNISIMPLGEIISGFDLGDIELISEDAIISSKVSSHKQSMMVAVALSDLLEGVCDLISNDEKNKYLFIGADSSFRLLFSRDNSDFNKISIENDDKIIMATRVDLASSLFLAAESFFEQNKQNVNKNDAAFTDLKDSISRFKGCFNKIS